jgi:hypothetical protein
VTRDMAWCLRRKQQHGPDTIKESMRKLELKKEIMG